MKRRAWIAIVLSVVLCISLLACRFVFFPGFPPHGVVCADLAFEEIATLQNSKALIPESFRFDDGGVRHFRCDAVRGFVQFEMSGNDASGHAFYLHGIAGGVAASGADSVLDVCYVSDGQTVTDVRFAGRSGTQSAGTCAYDGSLFTAPLSSYRYDRFRLGPLSI